MSGPGASLNFGTGDFTIAFKTNPATLGSTRKILDGTNWGVSRVAGAIQFELPEGNISGGTLTQDVYSDVVCVRAAGVSRLYVDNVDVANGTQAGAVSTAATFYVGSFAGVTSFYSGDLAELGIWLHGFSPEEVNAYSRGFTPLRLDTLLSYWQMSGRRTSAQDLMVNGLELTHATPAADYHANHPRVMRRIAPYMYDIGGVPPAPVTYIPSRMIV